ncbi:GNAT family N-acetyltransferase [Methylococcus capsulatus]|uniref:GNAT family N-acetyltransferase n=1 Tax=Methylococcus capsulatus TaxID=414 RepID=UPI001C52DF6C|nr:GNAT family N-acetyltransferase [Methylococcus capsulatus]QXP87602.1 GNAT family N-acetyltransferase [Methylococcus capsulatus]QXP92658.1 GNAT family N-acetyltransferase [Methylococcus capsulatus]UQN12618.1 GNAT family N-acetyltransferase [Methylococcus capsulatus]
MQQKFHIERMDRQRLELALDWAAAEGWNPGLHDAASFFAADPSGFFMGFLDDEPVGSISAVSYPGDFGFIGLYIVRPEHRGKGFGLKLWHAAVEHLGERTVGLDGVIERQSSYARSGFVTAHRNIRFEWNGPAALETDTAVGRLEPSEFDAILAYDAALFPGSRDGFLRVWTRQPGCTGLLYRSDDGDIAGYGLLRPCRRGYKLGPLFADTPRIAACLLQAFRPHAGTAPIYIDMPAPNTAALQLAARHGMRRVFETARMYTPRIPSLPLERTFGITTYELG